MNGDDCTSARILSWNVGSCFGRSGVDASVSAIPVRIMSAVCTVRLVCSFSTWTNRRVVKCASRSVVPRSIQIHKPAPPSTITSTATRPNTATLSVAPPSRGANAPEEIMSAAAASVTGRQSAAGAIVAPNGRQSLKIFYNIPSSHANIGSMVAVHEQGARAAASSAMRSAPRRRVVSSSAVERRRVATAPAPRALAQSAITILPRWPAAFMWWYAARASSNANRRSITGRSSAAAIARFIASNIARLPT